MKIDIKDPKKILDIAAKLPPDIKEFTKTYFMNKWKKRKERKYST